MAKINQMVARELHDRLGEVLTQLETIQDIAEHNDCWGTVGNVAQAKSYVVASLKGGELG
jgi:glucose-6-phosphate-specific signal transduction histidine kinase